MKIIPKSKFKPKTFEYFRLVEQTGEEIVITDHGKPVVKIIRTQNEDETILNTLHGSVLRYDDPLEPVALDDW